MLIDRSNAPGQYLLLGSASPALLRQAGESLLGRVESLEVGGFDLREACAAAGDRAAEAETRLWLRGGFPRSYLAASDEKTFVWRDEFIRSFLERDIPQFGITIPAETLRRFWTMIAHYHGQTWNGAEFARSLGTSEPTARRYLDIMAGAYMVRILPPWFENLGKRQVKAPKIYVRDTGLLHALLGVRSHEALLGHPKLGASWEGFVVEQLLATLRTRDAYYWATHNGSELDLMTVWNGKRYGFEVKYADAPGTTKSMHVALADLGLAHLWVIYPGEKRYNLTDTITVVPAREIPALVAALKNGIVLRG